MANELTGEFDVVAQFALPAVNRVLAAMHSSGRFPHSMTVRVDDTPPPTHGWRPSISGILDALGDPIVDAGTVGSGGGHRGAFDLIVNDIIDIATEPIVPSHMRGKAQLQLFPPTLQIASGGASRVAVRIQFLARYFPDTGTAPAAEYVRGELHITGAINEVASEVAHVMEVDIHPSTADIRFIPIWTSRALAAEDIAGIELLIRNALRTSFVPSSISLPPTISHVKFATLGSNNAVAALLNLAGAQGNPAVPGTAFLGASDHFALGVGRDYLLQQLAPTLQAILSEPIPPETIPIDLYLTTYHVTYTFTLTEVRLDFENGKMVCMLKGNARTGSTLAPNFSFTVRQALTLAVVGNTARLVIGSMDVDTSSWVVNIVKGRLKNRIAATRDEAFAKNDIDGTVQRMLSVDTNLGGMMASLLTPPAGQPSASPVNVRLAYTSAEIRTSGIVLHGSADVDEWPAPPVQFEKITDNTSIAVSPVVGESPTHSALLSWIPGGTIDRYEWRQNGSVVDVETNRFVLIPQQPSVMADEASPRRVHGFASMCLTVQGTRVSASGAVTPQAVTVTACTFPTFPVLAVDSLAAGEMPMIALAQPGDNGGVEVAGHAPATAVTGSASPNLIVRFAPDMNEASVDAILRAATQSERSDTELAITLVLPAAARARGRYDDRVIYADDEDGAWRRHFRHDSSNAATLVVNSKGSVIFKEEGAVDVEALASALKRLPVNRMPVRMRLASVNTRAGRLAHNFVFEHARGHTITLRKLDGRDVRLVFWRASSEESIAAVRSASTAKRAGNQQPVVLAINDGDSPETAKRAASEARLTATVVTDPDREISAAYGVSIWPTTISIGRDGRIRDVKIGAATNFKPEKDSGSKS